MFPEWLFMAFIDGKLIIKYYCLSFIICFFLDSMRCEGCINFIITWIYFIFKSIPIDFGNGTTGNLKVSRNNFLDGYFLLSFARNFSKWSITKNYYKLKKLKSKYTPVQLTEKPLKVIRSTILSIKEIL